MESSGKQFKKRNAILECLRNTTSHPSAEMVHDMLQAEHPDISLATVYRNLARFKAQGIIQSVATVRGIERFDANTNPHVHFICSGCDAVVDLHALQTPDSLKSAAAACAGGSIESCQLSFTGKCRDCINKQQGGETA